MNVRVPSQKAWVLVGGFVLVVGLGIAGYVGLSQPKVTDAEPKTHLSYGNYLWGVNESGLTVYEAKTAEVVLEDATAVESAYLSQTGEAGYLLTAEGNGMTLNRLKVSPEGIDYRPILKTNLAVTDYQGQWDGERGVLFDEKANQFHWLDAEELLVETLTLSDWESFDAVTAWTMTDDSLYVAQAHQIWKYDYATKEWSAPVSVESPVISLVVADESLWVTTTFGSASSQTPLIVLDAHTLAISSLHALTGGAVELVPALKADDSLYLYTPSQQTYRVLNRGTLKESDIKTKGLTPHEVMVGVDYVYERSATQSQVRGIYESQASKVFDQAFEAFYPLY